MKLSFISTFKKDNFLSFVGFDYIANIYNNIVFNTTLYHLTLLLYSEYRHVVYDVMTTRYITLSAGTSNVMTKSLITMQYFYWNKHILKSDKIAFKS